MKKIIITEKLKELYSEHPCMYACVCVCVHVYTPIP